jgi:penicillin-binding protein 1A
VWIGNDNNAPMVHATGGTLPAKIFHAFMADAETGLPVKPLPGAPSDAIASAIAPDRTAPATPAPEAPDGDKKPGTIEDLINNIFGKSGT